MVAIFDVDGVLLQCGTQSFFEWAVERGLNWSYTTYIESGNDWKTATGLETVDLNPLYAEFASTCLDRLHIPMAGAKEAFDRLNGYPRHVATARPEDLRQATTHHLQGFYGQFDGYHFGCKERKSEVIDRCDGKFFIDDSLLECRMVASGCSGVVVIRMPMRYGGHTPTTPGVTRLKAERQLRSDIDDQGWQALMGDAWSEVVDIILNDN